MRKKYRWTITPPKDPSLVARFTAEMNVPETITRILVNRDIDSYDRAREFFKPVIADLHDPFLMDGMDQAVGRVLAALQAKEKILVFIAGDFSATEVRQRDAAGYDHYPVRGLADGFIQNGSVPLDKIANGYEDAEAVWRALQTEPDAAIVDGFVIQGGFGPQEFSLKGIPEAVKYDAPRITVRDATRGRGKNVRVIGVISFGASSNFMGIYVGEDAFIKVFGEPELSMHFVALTDPDGSRQAAREIESALATAGVQADSLQQIVDENRQAGRGQGQETATGHAATTGTRSCRQIPAPPGKWLPGGVKVYYFSQKTHWPLDYTKRADRRERTKHMDHPQEIIPGVSWVGVRHPDLKVFDELFPTRNGTTYNAYLVRGRDQTALIDTVKAPFTEEFLASWPQPAASSRSTWWWSTIPNPITPGHCLSC